MTQAIPEVRLKQLELKKTINEKYGMDLKSAYPWAMTPMPVTFTMLDLILLRKKARVKIIKYQRFATCKWGTVKHFWGTPGRFWSWFIAWRTNPSGIQKCGCLFEYRQL